MSPFGEIRSALDMLNLHVVKVDNIVPNTGIVPTMQTLLKNTVKTQVGVPGRSDAQMAGSFDVCRAELLALLQRQQEAVDALPLFSKPAPQPSCEPASEPAAPVAEPSAEQPVVSAEPTAEPSVEQSVEPTTEQPAEQPMAEPEAEKGTEQPAEPVAEPSQQPAEPVTSPAANPAPEPAAKPAPEQPAPRASRSHTNRTSQLVKEVSAAVCTGVETLLRRVVERLNSLLSLVQAALPAAVAGFTEYFYTQIQQTLLWFLALLLKAQNAPHTLLYGPEKVLGAADPK
mgnify:FL=1